jgi:hypothetical protein
MVKFRKALLALFAGVPTFACAPKQVKIETIPSAQVSLHSLTNSQSMGEILGTTPLSIDLSKVEMKIVRMSAAGMAPQNFTFLPKTEGDLTISIRLTPEDPRNPSVIAAPPIVIPQPAPPSIPIPTISAATPTPAPAACPATPAEPTSDQNSYNRSLMEAVQAYKENNFALTVQITKKLASSHPRVAIASILMGLAHLHQGNLGDAKAAFSKAKAIDPHDKKIDALLKGVQ